MALRYSPIWIMNSAKEVHQKASGPEDNGAQPPFFLPPVAQAKANNRHMISSPEAARPTALWLDAAHATGNASPAGTARGQLCHARYRRDRLLSFARRLLRGC